jgi:GDP-L-fucose synthase
LHADDLARALVFLARLDDARYAQLTDPGRCPLINVGTGVDLTIRELAQTVAGVTGFGGEIVHDLSKPDGTPRKVLDVSRMRALGWQPSSDLRTGLAMAYDDYLHGVVRR